MKELKQGQRRKLFLKELRSLPVIDAEEFKKRHGFSPFVVATTPTDISKMSGKLGFKHRESNWRSR